MITIVVPARLMNAESRRPLAARICPMRGAWYGGSSRTKWLAVPAKSVDFITSPVAAALERLRRHDGGNGAAEAEQHRHEALARKPDPPHQPVRDEGRARHVPRVLENREREEHRTDNGDEGRDRLQAAAHAVRDHGDESVGRSNAFEERAETVDEDASRDDVEEVDRRAARIPR